MIFKAQESYGRSLDIRIVIEVWILGEVWILCFKL